MAIQPPDNLRQNLLIAFCFAIAANDKYNDKPQQQNITPYK